MSDESQNKTSSAIGRNYRLADHILSTSATMIGVYMTVISLSRLIPKQSLSRHVDEMLAFDSQFFLGSALLSYFSLRNPTNMEKFERIAVSFMVAVGFVVAFELMIG